MSEHIDDALLREAAAKAITGEQVMRATQAELENLLREVDRGDFAWMDIPSPEGSRAFQATSKSGCSILIAQYNHTEHGIGHAGTAIRMTRTGPLIINFPKPVADYIYHKAAAGRN